MSELEPILEPIVAESIAVELPVADADASPASFQDVLSCFLSTFVTIFLAEIGDKTQVATLLLSAQSHNPMTVFVGAATALVATSLVGVLLGRWLSKVLQPRTLERVTGIILAIVAVLLLIDVVGEWA
jgi:Ca2+/H+ antiporter, TMEM165/GDT1 family